jgi:hypothetical protein
MSSARTFSLLVSLALLVGCGNEIGDACETALDCSAQGSRLCDRTQPHGYCTLRGCEQGTCPEESVCVKFRPEQERLAVTYCMYGCEEDDDCRNDEGYECKRASDLGGADRGEAQILGDQSQRFCVAKPRPAVEPEMMMSMPDAAPNESNDSSIGSSDAGDDAAAADAAAADAASAADGAVMSDAASAIDGG